MLDSGSTYYANSKKVIIHEFRGNGLYSRTLTTRRFQASAYKVIFNSKQHNLISVSTFILKRYLINL